MKTSFLYLTHLFITLIAVFFFAARISGEAGGVCGNLSSVRVPLVSQAPLFLARLFVVKTNVFLFL